MSQAVYRSSLWRNQAQDLNIYRLVPNHKDMFSHPNQQETKSQLYYHAQVSRSASVRGDLQAYER